MTLGERLLDLSDLLKDVLTWAGDGDRDLRPPGLGDLRDLLHPNASAVSPE